MTLLFQRLQINSNQLYLNLFQTLRLARQASLLAVLGLLFCSLLLGFAPIGQAWIGKTIIDNVVTHFQAGTDGWLALQQMTPIFALDILLYVILFSVSQGRLVAERVLKAKLGTNINVLIARQAMKLDLSFFEQADFYDKLQNAQQEADRRGVELITDGLILMQQTLTLILAILMLARFSPWLPLILALTTVPSFITQNRYAQRTFELLSGQAPERRQMKYIEHLLTVDTHAKEVKLFGVGQLMLGRYLTLFRGLFQADIALAGRRSLASIGWGLSGILSFYFCILWIIFRAITGSITLGDAVLYLEMFRLSQGVSQQVFIRLTSVYEHSLFMSNLFDYLAQTPRMVQAATPHQVPDTNQATVEFRNVSFQYPETDEYALHNINLTLRPGEKLALVGINGAGKTTLIKLLTRLYDPTTGQILLNGVDLRDYDLAAWQQEIGVIFQDFVKYQLPARENIGFGQIQALDDCARIKQAAQKGGAHDILADLPQGYDTMLGKWFEDGHELSGGQWQKVALSRAFMRDAGILVLDEPTAALDAEQEYIIFQQFRKLTEGKTAIVISHRFSTVRMADRIAVIDGGTITELGSHQELMGLNGAYAHLFNIQAQGYL